MINTTITSQHSSFLRKILMGGFLAIFMCVSCVVQAEANIEGRWITVDDDGETEKSIIELKMVNGLLTGTILKVLKPKEDNPSNLCKKCKGDKKNQPIEGMMILRDMKKDGSEWTGGKILDPSSGKEYSCTVELTEGGAKLKVRGYIGFSLLGRTQYWKRKATE